MKNILGKKENLKLYNKEGKLVYEFVIESYSYRYEDCIDSNGKPLTYKNSDGYSYEYTFDSFRFSRVLEAVDDRISLSVFSLRTNSESCLSSRWS